LLFLALLDQERKLRAFLRQLVPVPVEPVALFGDSAAHACELRKVRKQRIGLLLHFGQYRSQQHSRAQRLESIFSAHQESGRRMAAYPLQCGEHLAHSALAAVEGLAQHPFADVKRL